MLALQALLAYLLENPLHIEYPIMLSTRRLHLEDPQDLTARERQVFMQWIPSHWRLEGNEGADTILKQASSLDQTES